MLTQEQIDRITQVQSQGRRSIRWVDKISWMVIGFGTVYLTYHILVWWLK